MKRLFKKYFIPHKGNDHKPHILRTEAVLFFLGLILITEAWFLFEVTFLGVRSDFFAAIFSSVLIEEANKSRQEQSVALLTVSPVLEQAAKLKAQDMVQNGYFAHVSPNGITPWYWFDKAGYSFSLAGENLAVNFFDSKDVADAWMNSPTHRANILNAGFTEIGIATTQGMYQGREAIYVVQLFGRPAIKQLNIAKADILESKVKTVVPVGISTATPSVKETFVAVKGAEAQIKEELLVPSLPSEWREVSIVEKAVSAPRTTASYLYFVLMTIVSLALVLKVFINIKVQHSHLIIRGLGLLIVISSALWLNQYVSFVHAFVY